MLHVRKAVENFDLNQINPIKVSRRDGINYVFNGQHTVELNDDLTEATGTAYCEATLVNEVDGKDVMTTNYVRYADVYVKVDSNWYIKRRRTTFIISDKHTLS